MRAGPRHVRRPDRRGGSGREGVPPPPAPVHRGPAGSVRRHRRAGRRLRTIPGSVPAAGEFPDGCVFRNRCAFATDECAVRPPWVGPDASSGYACHHPAEEWSPGTSASEPSEASVPEGHPQDHPVRGGQPVIVVEDLVRDYQRPRTSLTRPGRAVHALAGVSFEVGAGERFGIVGESGCGKSTLLRLLAGLDRPTSGRVVVEGTDIAPLRERQLRFLRDRLQVVFQDPMSSLDPRMRVRDIVAEPLVAQRHTARRTGSPSWSARSAYPRRRSIGIRTSSPAVSGNASPSPAHWRRRRTSSWPTSRSVRSTSRSVRKCSTSSATSSTSWS